MLVNKLIGFKCYYFAMIFYHSRLKMYLTFLFLGVAVPSVLVVQAGKTLHELTSATSTWSWSSVLLLATFAALSLLPVLFKAKLRDKFD